MKKLTLAENFYQYQFPPRAAEQHFGFNIFALTHGSDALLVDTAFEEQAAAAKADLAAQNIQPSQAIISHFHDDHFRGLRAFPNLRVLGSEAYQVPNDYFKPTEIICDASRLKFGNFEIHFIAAPGHSPSDLFTVINNQFVHVGDTLIYSNEGAPILPFVARSRVSEHIAALEKLKEFKDCTLLPGHGAPISGETVILEAIHNRIQYLDAVLRSPTPITCEEATRECNCTFLHPEWHEFLYA